jgi:hypothetical protein
MKTKPGTYTRAKLAAKLVDADRAVGGLRCDRFFTLLAFASRGLFPRVQPLTSEP